MSSIILAVHAGAGRVERDTLDTVRELACRQALANALIVGFTLLQQQRSAVDAVQAAVESLEDFEEFNAGLGSVLNALGRVEMDAAIMEGSGRKAGAVASVLTIKNPIRAARAVMEKSPHAMLVGVGAETFAVAHDVTMVPADYFIVPARREQLAQSKERDEISMDHRGLGTVGAVACDAQGQLAAATSTGGMTNKLPGRVGDSAIIGAGIWADNATCAVSATGHGEAFMRTVFAHEVDALMRYAGCDLHTACNKALAQVQHMGYNGGCIAVNSAGNIALCFNTPAMYRGWIGADGMPQAAIFGDEHDAG